MKKNKIGFLIIASAIIWGVVIVACSMTLKETPYKDQITHILLGGVTCHLLFIWAPLGQQFKKNDKDKQ